jgi:hypothetical protein
VNKFCFNLIDGRYVFGELGSIQSTKILRSKKFSEKSRKILTYQFCQKGHKNCLADVLARLAYKKARNVN